MQIVVFVPLASPDQWLKFSEGVPALAGTCTRRDCPVSTPIDKVCPAFGVTVPVPFEFPVPLQVALVLNFLQVAVKVGPELAILRLPSVKVVVAMPDAPEAVAVYVATNQSGRLNSSRMFPLSSAKTSTLRLQVLPRSSFTLI
jgi:hypothetical protein